MRPLLFLVILLTLLSIQQIVSTSSHLYTLRDYLEKRVHVADLQPLKDLWKDGLIPYKFSSQIPESLRKIFLEATHQVSNNSCIRFKEVTSDTEAKQYPGVLEVVLSSQPGLCAAEGEFAIKTTLKLSSDCGVLGVTIPGVIVHELLHILGFKHTQMRTDRDKHIQLNLDEVPDDRVSQFAKGNKKLVSDGRWPYDPLSILHYSQHADSKDKNVATIQSKDGTQFNDVMGQRRHLSPFDILELNDAYCDGKVPETANDYEFLQKLLKEKEARQSLKESKRGSSRVKSSSAERIYMEDDEEEIVFQSQRRRRFVQKLRRVVRALRLLL